MTTSTYSSYSTTFENDPDSFEEEGQNVWNQMLEAVKDEESRQKILGWLREEDVFKVALSCSDAKVFSPGEKPE